MTNKNGTQIMTKKKNGSLGWPVLDVSSPSSQFGACLAYVIV